MNTYINNGLPSQSTIYPVFIPGSINTVDWLVYQPNATLPWTIMQHASVIEVDQVPEFDPSNAVDQTKDES